MTASVHRFDLAIAGAGFAGLACAQQAAARGLRVVVVDRKPAPGTRVHTTGILVREAAEIWTVPVHLVREVPRVRLYAPNLSAVDLASPGYAFYATNTPDLLRWYADQTRAAGVDIRFGFDAAGARRDDDEIVLGDGALRTRYLVGADGARSAVAEAFGLGVNRHFLIGMEAEFEGLGGVDGDYLHTFLDNRLAPGYIAWVVPSVDGISQVGLACRRLDKPSLDRFIDKIRPLFDFAGARIVARRSGPIPVGGQVRPISAKNVLLTGDAAGLVSPLTAGGIYTALKFGRRAGDLVADYLDTGAPDPGAALTREYPRFFWKSLMRRAADFGVPNPILNAALALPPLRRLAQLVYFHNKGLASADAWRDLVRPGSVEK